jgi:hypothetical protein
VAVDSGPGKERRERIVSTPRLLPGALALTLAAVWYRVRKRRDLERQRREAGLS